MLRGRDQCRASGVNAKETKVLRQAARKGVSAPKKGQPVLEHLLPKRRAGMGLQFPRTGSRAECLNSGKGQQGYGHLRLKRDSRGKVPAHRKRQTVQGILLHQMGNGIDSFFQKGQPGGGTVSPKKGQPVRESLLLKRRSRDGTTVFSTDRQPVRISELRNRAAGAWTLAPKKRQPGGGADSPDRQQGLVSELRIRGQQGHRHLRLKRVAGGRISASRQDSRDDGAWPPPQKNV